MSNPFSLGKLARLFKASNTGKVIGIDVNGNPIVTTSSGASGSGATGGGSDNVFLEADQVVTQNWTIGSASYADCSFTASNANINATGHQFVIGSRVRFKTSTSMPTNILVDNVYYVIAISAGVSIQISATEGGGAIVPDATVGTGVQISKIKNAIITSPFIQAPGTVITVEAGTVVTQV